VRLLFHTSKLLINDDGILNDSSAAQHDIGLSVILICWHNYSEFETFVYSMTPNSGD
jgi:hypothetical protein